MTEADHTKLFDHNESRQSTVHGSNRRSPPEKKRVTLQDCFERFAQREQLGENDKWYCSNCKEQVCAYKKMDLWRLPPVLVVHLKRFQYAQGFYSSYLRGKIDDMVHFPTRELDLSSATLGPSPAGEPPIYDLFAVSVC